MPRVMYHIHYSLWNFGTIPLEYIRDLEVCRE